MGKLKVVGTSDVIETSDSPIWKGGVWECGDQRFVDPDQSLYEIAPLATALSVIDFKLLFTSAERVAIQEARATDPVIDDFFNILDDVRLENVRRNLPVVQNALAFLESSGLIGEGRAEEILYAVV